MAETDNRAAIQFRYLIFEVPSRHWSGGIEQTVAYMSLEFQEEIQAKHIFGDFQHKDSILKYEAR